MTENNAEQVSQQVEILSIYVKDISVESPLAPKIFMEKWTPEIQLDLNVSNRVVDGDCYEVTLALTIRTKKKDQIAFLIEIQQAGFFRISGFEEPERSHLLGVYFPSLLYPYAREVIAGLFQKANFAPLHLTPVNFEALYQQRKQAEAGKTGARKPEENKDIH